MSPVDPALRFGDLVSADFLNWRWLGLDLRLIDGDLSFGDDGDLVSHTEPIESFVDVVKHRSQVAGTLAASASPYGIHNTIRAALNAIVEDPRVGSVKILQGEWRVIDSSVTPVKTDPQYYVVSVRIILVTGDVINNLVLPVLNGSE